ncbi:alpha/beta fold hydrolase [Streptosporangium carneum]|uniref:Hydrolase n=1 Tax=Streptosporangium carneum TaxID=47481 RepID=A0A9W6MFR1_9ACTN|nr:alpha/beta hydrolase [Streptosporangium carneum]GLK12340.1 hydrolase [Streptosporangium carneum]
MPVISVNGIRLNYKDTGSGEPVLMVMGTGAGHRVWELHQVPALVEAGYRVITFDNRGIPPSDECAEGFTVHDMVGDVAGLIERLGIGPCRVVGTSMGAYVAQELALARPELVRQAVLMATRGRSDTVRSALAVGEIELGDSGVEPPARYRAAVQALQVLSPSTLNDDLQAKDWLDLFELTLSRGPGVQAQLRLDPMPDRLDAYRRIGVPCLVISFADDLITPPHHGRAVAEAIPGAIHEELAACGHYGYLEDPAGVNKRILAFFERDAPAGGHP